MTEFEKGLLQGLKEVRDELRGVQEGLKQVQQAIGTIADEVNRIRERQFEEASKYAQEQVSLLRRVTALEGT